MGRSPLVGQGGREHDGERLAHLQGGLQHQHQGQGRPGFVCCFVLHWCRIELQYQWVIDEMWKCLLDLCPIVNSIVITGNVMITLSAVFEMFYLNDESTSLLYLNVQYLFAKCLDVSPQSVCWRFMPEISTNDLTFGVDFLLPSSPLCRVGRCRTRSGNGRRAESAGTFWRLSIRSGTAIRRPFSDRLSPSDSRTEISSVRSRQDRDVSQLMAAKESISTI